MSTKGYCLAAIEKSKSNKTYDMCSPGCTWMSDQSVHLAKWMPAPEQVCKMFDFC